MVPIQSKAHLHFSLSKLFYTHVVELLVDSASE